MTERQTPRVADFMTPGPLTITSDSRLLEADRLMRKAGVRHLPVTCGERVVGMLSQRDIYVVESLTHVGLAEISVEEAMAEEPYTVREVEAVDVVAEHMARKRLGSALVVDDTGSIVGVFTTHDALLALRDLLTAELTD